MVKENTEVPGSATLAMQIGEMPCYLDNVWEGKVMMKPGKTNIFPFLATVLLMQDLGSVYNSITFLSERFNDFKF